MTNNYILKRTKYIFAYSATKMVEVFALADETVTTQQIKGWARKDDDPELVELSDKMLATFLNGFIIEKRGKKDGAKPVAENKLNNNIVLRKFKIALNLKDTDIQKIFVLSHIDISKHELSSFFRDKNHRSYRLCKDQFLRNFFHGLHAKFRDDD